jgi:hypothetical protein
VDVKILVSKGLLAPVNVAKPNPASSSLEPQRQSGGSSN